MPYADVKCEAGSIQPKWAKAGDLYRYATVSLRKHDERKALAAEYYDGNRNRFGKAAMHELNGFKNIATNGSKITMSHYDESDCCEKSYESPKALRKQAKRLLKDAAEAERQAKADRKAKKAALKEHKQWRADRELVIETLRLSALNASEYEDRIYAAVELDKVLSAR